MMSIIHNFPVNIFLHVDNPGQTGRSNTQWEEQTIAIILFEAPNISVSISSSMNPACVDILLVLVYVQYQTPCSKSNVNPRDPLQRSDGQMVMWVIYQSH